jgi:hypothetical protein
VLRDQYLNGVRLRDAAARRAWWRGIRSRGEKLMQMKHSLVVSCVAIVGVCLQSTATQAAVIFEQLPTYDGTNYISSPIDGAGNPGIRAADDFTLAVDTLIDDVHWWGFHAPPSSGNDDFSITFYADDSGLPGTLLFTTSVAVVVEDDTNPGSPSANDKFYSSILDDPFLALGGETYWLSIFNAEADASWSWRSSSAAADVIARTPFASTDWSETRTVNLNFQLTSSTVPEPATLAMMSLALAGLGISRRKCVGRS